MKRWLSLTLSLMMIFTTVLGDISLAIAEETETEAVSTTTDQSGQGGNIHIHPVLGYRQQ